MPDSTQEFAMDDISMKNNDNDKEHDLIGSLGISLKDNNATQNNTNETNNDTNNNDSSAPDLSEDAGYEVVPNPNAEAVDLSGIRGNNNNTTNNNNNNNNNAKGGDLKNDASDEELDALEELVPDVKNRRRSNELSTSGNKNNNNMTVSGEGDAVEVQVDAAAGKKEGGKAEGGGGFAKRHSMESTSSTRNHNITTGAGAGAGAGGQGEGQDMTRGDSMRVMDSKDFDDSNKPSGGGGDDVVTAVKEGNDAFDEYNADYEASSSQDDDTTDGLDNSDMYAGLDGNDSDNAIGVAGGGAAEAADPKTPALDGKAGEKIPKEFLNNMSSGQSLSTATQTHEVRMPMYLPTFKPATGCTNASDFIVRCFVARLRSGITVVKHGRSRWCKSRLRILHIHPDGCSLSWKPAEGEPTSNRRPPKLDLTQCLEVRHAWSPDPQNPMYTGTPILRQKCEAANAHKSFALIFPKRTVDITAVTADQCKVLMEGFSALCFRLQVADLAGKGAKKGNGRGMPEEDGVSTTASVTLTNSSTPRAR